MLGVGPRALLMLANFLTGTHTKTSKQLGHVTGSEHMCRLRGKDEVSVTEAPGEMGSGQEGGCGAAWCGVRQLQLLRALKMVKVKSQSKGPVRI